MMLDLWIWIFLKHFICDFPLQMFPYQYKNKGTYGHPGGLLHAGIHAVGMFLVCWYLFFPFFTIFLLAIADGVIHYHIDFIKMNINRIYDLTPTNSEWFWVLLGADQLAHYMTYVFLFWMAGL